MFRTQADTPIPGEKQVYVIDVLGGIKRGQARASSPVTWRGLAGTCTEAQGSWGTGVRVVSESSMSGACVSTVTSHRRRSSLISVRMFITLFVVGVGPGPATGRPALHPLVLVLTRWLRAP